MTHVKLYVHVVQILLHVSAIAMQRLSVLLEILVVICQEFRSFGRVRKPFESKLRMRSPPKWSNRLCRANENILKLVVN